MRAACLMLPLLGACDDTTFEASSSGGGTSESGYDGAVEIFTSNCLTGCHSATSMAGNLNLETDPCTAAVSVPSSFYPGNIIEPGDAAASVMWNKLSDTDSSTYGGVMPVSGQLDQASIDVITTWIDDGAPCTSGGGDTGEPSGDDTGTADVEYTFSRIATEIWPQCTGCHYDGGTAVPFFGDDPANLINQKSNYYSGEILVVPGDPEGSLLFNKVRGTQSNGDQMPPYGDGLDTDAVTLIYGWILEGAK